MDVRDQFCLKRRVETAPLKVSTLLATMILHCKVQLEPGEGVSLDRQRRAE